MPGTWLDCFVDSTGVMIQVLGESGNRKSEIPLVQFARLPGLRRLLLVCQPRTEETWPA